MNNYPITAVFEMEDDIEGMVEREISINSLYVAPEEPVRLPEGSVYGSPPKTSFMGQGSSGWGGKKRKTRKGRKSTNSSRVQRRSKTRRSRRATGGGR